MSRKRQRSEGAIDDETVLVDSLKAVMSPKAYLDANRTRILEPDTDLCALLKHIFNFAEQ
jgi:hypothetical protein